MPSPPGKVDQLDLKFLFARTGFLLLGALATALLTVFVPAFSELDTSWSPLVAMALTALAELLHRIVRDNTRFPTIVLLVVLIGAGSACAGELIKDMPAKAKEHTLIEINGVEGESWAWIIKRLPDGFRPQARYYDAGRTCLWTGPPGTYDVDVIALKEGVLTQDFVQLTIEPTDPPPPQPTPDPQPDNPTPDDPTPNVPGDPFDNIGQRVAVWAKGLEGRGTAAGVYKAAAQSLRTDPSKTIDDVGADVVANLKSGVNYDSYASLRANVNADLQARWPLSRGLMADYFAAVAAGLSAQ